ncbi:MAG: hypothetical protein N3D18_07140 [Roseococcus sp.]|nr:hypothetical protein [Roseococcus sp.]
MPPARIRAQCEAIAPRCDLLLAWCTDFPAAALGGEVAGRPLWDSTLLGVAAALGMMGASSGTFPS